jgi:hypothetical protein
LVVELVKELFLAGRADDRLPVLLELGIVQRLEVEQELKVHVE